jgi:hypothetical protein
MDAASITGTTLADSSGNHNDGTLVGFPQNPTAQGKFGQALVYPGTANVQIPKLGLDLASGGANSVSLWFFAHSGRTSNDILALLPNMPTRYDLWFHNNNDLCINTRRGECWGIHDTTLLDRWVHVVATFVNGSTSKDNIFVDGKNGNAACLTTAGYMPCTAAIGAAATPVELGGESDFPFHGMLDEVRIYNRELTGGEVSTLYSGAVCP